MRFFKDVTTVEEAKKLYRQLARKHHPDVGGDHETMVQIVNEYEEIMKRLEKKEGNTDFSSSEAFRAIIDKLIAIDGIDIEIIGTWVWVSGNTYATKDKLKEIGLKFSNNKKSWYWHEGEYHAHHKKKFSMDELRMMHEVKTVKTTGRHYNKQLGAAL